MSVQPLTERRRARVNQILKEEWNCPPSVSRGRLIDTTSLPGFLFMEGEDIIGVVTYYIEESECEIVTLNSFRENRGIGTALVHSVLEVAKKAHCKRLWLVTTNDDINAIRFYQKKEFELIAVHINAMQMARQQKPSIPLIGMDDIPIKHEFEFEIQL